MATEFRLPKLHESIETGVVVKVPVSVGDAIAEDQSILEIETDKAIAEVPSTISGTVKEIHVKEGDEVSPGDLVFTVEAGPEARAAEEPSQDDGMPAETVGTTDQTPERDGEAAAQPQPEQADEPARRPEPDDPARQTDPEEPARSTPPAARQSAPRTGGRRLDEGTPVRAQAATDGEERIIPAAPSTRRFAREIGIDIGQVSGSGPGGRIAIADVKAHSRRQNQAGAPALQGRVAIPLPDFSQWGETERKPMGGVRRKTAEHLSQVWATAPHVTQFDQADITDLETLRKRYAGRAQDAGGKLTVTAIIIKVIASALKVFPQFNTSVDMVSHEVVYKKYYHVGVAVDTEHGLLVPVIRDVDQKNLIELSLELNEIAEKTRQRKLTMEEMQGGSFTVSNLGGIGGTSFTPIVNAPEVAILGVARGKIEPLFVEGDFVPRTMLPLALSYDHRVIDGADGARFLRWVVDALEHPFLLSLEG